MNDQESRIGKRETADGRTRLHTAFDGRHRNDGRLLFRTRQIDGGQELIAVIDLCIHFLDGAGHRELHDAEAVRVGLEPAHQLLIGENVAVGTDSVTCFVHGPDTEPGGHPLHPASAFGQELDVDLAFPVLFLFGERIGDAGFRIDVFLPDLILDHLSHIIVFHRIAKFDVLVEHILRFPVEHPVGVAAKGRHTGVQVVGNLEPAAQHAVAPFDLHPDTDGLLLHVLVEIDVFLDHRGNQLHIHIVAGREFRQAGSILQIGLEPDGVARAVNFAVGLQIKLLGREQLGISVEARKGFLRVNECWRQECRQHQDQELFRFQGITSD